MLNNTSTPITHHITPLSGQKLTGYELPQLWIARAEEWENWMELTITLLFGEMILSVSWSELDLLWLSNKRELPSSVVDHTLRWTDSGVPQLDQLIGETLQGATLQSGNHAYLEEPLLTDLVLSFESGKELVIYNALDENGLMVREAAAVSA